MTVKHIILVVAFLGVTIGLLLPGVQIARNSGYWERVNGKAKEISLQLYEVKRSKGALDSFFESESFAGNVIPEHWHRKNGSRVNVSICPLVFSNQELSEIDSQNVPIVILLPVIPSESEKAIRILSDLNLNETKRFISIIEHLDAAEKYYGMKYSVCIFNDLSVRNLSFDKVRHLMEEKGVKEQD